MYRLAIPLVLLLAACGDHAADAAGPFRPPKPLEGQEPIAYPPELYNQGVEGEVMLYVVVDTDGTVLRDSTRIAKGSGQTAFDSAAIAAAPTLRFVPAMRGDTAVVSPIQVPIQFILPDSLHRAESE